MIAKLRTSFSHSKDRNSAKLDAQALRRLGFSDKIAMLVGTVGGIGFLRPASGTWGSIPGFFFFIALARMHRPMSAVAIEIAMLALGIWSSGRCERILGCKDPKDVVIDEMACVPVALWPVAAHVGAIPWFCWVLLFGAYRLSDIIKPFPAGWVERLKGGWGVMLDDFVSATYLGVLTFACVHLV